ncbi:MAG: GNAT family N-acetyltransferase [Armatimonadaceae bacterium]
MSQAVWMREARPGDTEAIREIYNWAVANTTATLDTEPRSLEAQHDWMARHDGNPYPLLVATHPEDGTVLGYACLSPYNPKPGYRTTAENSVYVHPDWHGLGIGSALLTALLAEADAREFVALIALITADNTASIRLHSRLGFETVGTLRQVGRKFNRWVDVTVLQRLHPLS